jgi:hypothetical protein
MRNSPFVIVVLQVRQLARPDFADSIMCAISEPPFVPLASIFPSFCPFFGKLSAIF